MNRACVAACALAVALAAPKGVVAQEGRHACTLTLTNRDQVRGHAATIVDGQLAFYPVVMPDSRVLIDLQRVDRIRFTGQRRGGGPPGAKVLALRDGSVLRGRFVKLTAKALYLDLEGFGPLAVPRIAIKRLGPPKAPRPTPSAADARSRMLEARARALAIRQQGLIVRGGVDIPIGIRPVPAPPPPQEPEAPKGRHDAKHHVVTLKDDMALSGDLEQDRDGLLVIRGGAIEARFRYAEVVSITFPVQPSGPPPSAGAAQVMCTVTTAAGSRLTGSAPQLSADSFSLTFVGSQRVTLPLQCITEVAFTTTGRAAVRRAVLVWGAYADRQEEYARTLAALRQGLEPSWRVHEELGARFGGAFRDKLVACGALLIPEMERAGSATLLPLASQLKPLAAELLRRGGNVVVLGANEVHTRFLAQAGLLDVARVGARAGVEVPFTPAGQRLADDIGKTFRTTNSTQFYRIGSSRQAEALAGSRDCTPLVGRRVDAGWIILMGMDYYESTEQTRKLLANAITLR